MSDFLGMGAYAGQTQYTVSDPYYSGDPGAYNHGQIATDQAHTVHYGDANLHMGAIDSDQASGTLLIGVVNAGAIQFGGGSTTLVFAGDMTVSGNLTVQGSSITSQVEEVVVSDNHFFMNWDYLGLVAETGGMVVNYLATSDQSTVVAMPAEVTLTGTVSGTVGTAAITGVGTAFTTEYTVGDWMVIDTAGDGNGREAHIIQTITDNTNIVLASNLYATHAGETHSRNVVPGGGFIPAGLDNAYCALDPNDSETFTYSATDLVAVSYAQQSTNNGLYEVLSQTVVELTRTGTLSITSGTDAITGVGTAFTSEYQEDGWIVLDADGGGNGREIHQIATITNDTSMTLYTNATNNHATEDHSEISSTLQVKGVGQTSTVEDFTDTDFVEEDGVAPGGIPLIGHVNVSVLRAGTDGIWETGIGNQTALSFSDLASATGITLNSVYQNNGNTVLLDDGSGTIVYRDNGITSLDATQYENTVKATFGTDNNDGQIHFTPAGSFYVETLAHDGTLDEGSKDLHVRTGVVTNPGSSASGSLTMNTGSVGTDGTSSGGVLIYSGLCDGSSQSGNVEVYSGNQPQDSVAASGYIKLYTGTCQNGDSGVAELYSGNVTDGGGSADSGDISVYSGTVQGGESGTVDIYTGNASNVGTSGAMTLKTGTTTVGGTTGNIDIYTGDGVSGITGNVSIRTGSASGAANTGDLFLYTGSGTTPAADGDAYLEAYNIYIGKANNRLAAALNSIQIGNDNATAPSVTIYGPDNTAAAITIAEGGGTTYMVFDTTDASEQIEIEQNTRMVDNKRFYVGTDLDGFWYTDNATAYFATKAVDSTNSMPISSITGNTTTSGNSGAYTVASGNAATASGAVSLYSGTASGGLSGAATLYTGTGTTGTGLINIYSGNASAGPSGAATLATGSGTTGTGIMTLGTGNASAGTSGAAVLSSGGGTSGTGLVSLSSGNASAGGSGTAAVYSGNATGGNSGDVSIYSGTAAGNTSGDVNITCSATATTQGDVNVTANSVIYALGATSDQIVLDAGTNGFVLEWEDVSANDPNTDARVKDAGSILIWRNDGSRGVSVWVNTDGTGTGWVLIGSQS